MRRLWLPACLLNVRLALRAVNAPTAYGRNVVAGGFCPINSYNELNLMPYFPRMIKMDWVGFEPTTSAMLYPDIFHIQN